jgi:membrane protein YdbS with pleckstrin-like domain
LKECRDLDREFRIDDAPETRGKLIAERRHNEFQLCPPAKRRVDRLVPASQGQRTQATMSGDAESYDVGMSDDRSLAVGEESVEVLHPHWKTLMRPIALAFVVVAVVLAGEVFIPAGKTAAIERLALAVVAIALLMCFLMYPLLVWRTTRYEVTTKRLRLRTGVIARDGRDIPLSRITDVSFRKTLLDRFLGCGTLIVESAGEHGETTLREIPHVERVSAMMFQLVEDERLRAVQNSPGEGQGGRPDAW